MSRSTLYTLIGVLIAVLVVLVGYMVYNQTREPALEIRLDSNGLEVTGNG